MSAGSGDNLTDAQLKLTDWVWVIRVNDMWLAEDHIDIVLDSGQMVQCVSSIVAFSFVEGINYKALDYSFECAVTIELNESISNFLDVPLSYYTADVYLISRSLGWESRIEYILKAKLSNPQYRSKSEPISFSIEVRDNEKESFFPYVWQVSDIYSTSGTDNTRVEKNQEEYSSFIWGKMTGVTKGLPIISTMSRLDTDYPAGTGFAKDRRTIDVLVAGHPIDTGTYTLQGDGGQYSWLGSNTVTTSTFLHNTYEKGAAMTVPSPNITVDASIAVTEHDADGTEDQFVIWDGTKAGLGSDYGGYDAASCLRFLMSFISEDIDWADINKVIPTGEKYELAFYVNAPETDIKKFINEHFAILGFQTCYTAKGVSLISRPISTELQKDYTWEFEDTVNCELTSDITEENSNTFTGISLAWGKSFTKYKNVKVVTANPHQEVVDSAVNGHIDLPDVITYEPETVEESPQGTINVGIVNPETQVKSVESIVINSEQTASLAANEMLFWEGRPTIELEVQLRDYRFKRCRAGHLIKYTNTDLGWVKYGYISSIDKSTENISATLTLIS